METLEAIKKRRSTREFSRKPLEKEKLEKIIEAAGAAPTARGIEPWEFIIVSEPETRKKISDIAENGRFIKDAGCCIIVLCKETKYHLEDGCAATENILLAATGLGIASCWVAGDKKPYASDIKRLLNVPEEMKLISMIALGYPENPGAAHKKRSLNEILHWEKF